MKLQVKTTHGKFYAVDINDDATVAQLKVRFDILLRYI
jgi:hypothetical protein